MSENRNDHTDGDLKCISRRRVAVFGWFIPTFCSATLFLSAVVYHDRFDLRGEDVMWVVSLMPLIIVLISILNLWIMFKSWKGTRSAFLAGFILPSATILLLGFISRP